MSDVHVNVFFLTVGGWHMLDICLILLYTCILYYSIRQDLPERGILLLSPPTHPLSPPTSETLVGTLVCTCTCTYMYKYKVHVDSHWLTT